MFVFILLMLAVISPLVFAMPARSKPWFALTLVSATAVLCITTALVVLISDSDVAMSGTSDLIFGIGTVVVDSLSAMFMIITSIAAISVTIYAKSYLKAYDGKKSPAHISMHYMCLSLLYIAMILVVVSRDSFSFLFSWEMMTIASFFLILFDAEKREVRRAALNYLILMHIGFVFLLAGFVTLSAAGYTASFDSLGAYFDGRNPVPLFLIFLVGFGMKAGIFPLHLWLPEAHPAAPAHISALMSGIMIKMGVYGIIRVTSAITDGLFAVGIIIFTVGVVTGLWGVILCAVQNSIKRLLAYSSIENIGVIFIGIGAAAIGRSAGNDMLALCAMSGALLHTVNHSMFKSLLFFGAGNVYSSVHSDSLDSLGGLSGKMPFTTGIFLIGAMAISALPPLSGFVSEYLIYLGLFETVGTGSGGIITAICGIVSLSLIGGVALLAFTKLFGVAFLGTPRSHAVLHAEEVNTGRLAAAAIPAAGIILIGLTPFLLTGGMFSLAGSVWNIEDAAVWYAGVSGQVFGIVSALVILLLSTTALLIVRRMQHRRHVVSRSEVWGCGFTAPNSRMQYSGESFSEGLYGISTSLTKSSGSGDVVDKDEIFPTPHSFKVRRKDKMSTLFSRWWVEMIKWINLRVMKFNTGKVNHYILYALLFLSLILLLSITGII